MNIGIFADGAPAIGAGHQVRMAALAQALLAAGHQATLCCRDLPGSTHVWAWTGLPSLLLPAGDTPVQALARCPGDVLVVDHYGIAGADLALGRPVLAVDDVPGRDLAAARLVLNQNLGVDPGTYGDRGLVGPAFALLRPAFVGLRWRGSAPAPVLLMPGGTDHRGIAASCAVRLLAAGRQVIAIGGDLPSHAGLTCRRGLAAAEIAGLMADVSVAVIGAGSAVYEAIAVGVPFVALHTADNQDRIAVGLAQASIAAVLTPAQLDDLPAAVAAAVPPPSLVDGQGARRVVQALESRCRA